MVNDGPERKVVTVVQAGPPVTEPLVTQDEHEVALLQHFRREPHLQRDCPLCLIEFDRNGYMRRHSNAQVAEAVMQHRLDAVLTPLSYAYTAGVNVALSYFNSEDLILIFAGIGDD